MRLLVILALLAGPAQAEVVNYQGRDLVTFEIPGLSLVGQRGSRITWKAEDLKVNVTVRTWIGLDKAETEYREDRQKRRADPYARLNPELEIAGADKALSYVTEEPFEGHALVLYTEDFRCEFLLTGAAAGKAFEQLVGSVVVLRK